MASGVRCDGVRPPGCQSKLTQRQVAEALWVRGACGHTNSDGLWALIAGHVDGDSGGAGGDDQGRVKQIQLDQDATGQGAVVVAHLDLSRLGKSLTQDTGQNTWNTENMQV